MKMTSTKEFSIWEKPSGLLESVKKGWSWPAFFFFYIWALFKKMIAIGLGVLAVLTILILTTVPLDSERIASETNIVGIVSVFLCFAFGAFGNKMRENNLKSKGFVFKGIVIATNNKKAKTIYLEKKGVNKSQKS